MKKCGRVVGREEAGFLRKMGMNGINRDEEIRMGSWESVKLVLK